MGTKRSCLSFLCKRNVIFYTTFRIFIFLIYAILVLSAFAAVTRQSPFLVSLIIIAYSILIGIFLRARGLKWFAFSLILMFLGGIIIVFVYASSLSRRSKLVAPSGALRLLILCVVVRVLLYYSPALHYWGIFSEMQVKPLFSLFAYKIICTLGIVLLITLFLLIKIIKFERGSLKL